MTENDFKNITDLYNKLKDIEKQESTVVREIGLDNWLLFDSLKYGINQYKDKIKGKELRIGSIVDKIYYEHQDEIRAVIINILNKELEKIVAEKNQLKKQFENIRVGKIGEEKSNNED